MRLYFQVNTFMNLYLWDPAQKAEVIGSRVREKTLATKKSHLLTIDKLVMQMPLKHAYNQDQLPDTNKDVLKQRGPNEGVYISDFDNFMPKGNPIVNFVEEYDDPKANKSV